jgi:hypothetical protein
MIKRWMSKTALLALVLACASTGAYAIPIDSIDFEDVAPGLYTAPSSFATTANGGAGNTYTFNVNGGQAAVDNGASGSNSDTACIGNGGTGCSSNGTQALYVFSSSGNGTVTLYPSAGNMLSLLSFDAAIATIFPGACALGLGTPPNCVLFQLSDNTLSTDILVTGQRSAGFGANPTPIDIELSPPADETFATQTLVDFINLDWVSFAFNGTSTFCNNGCSTDFAIDNLNATLTPTQSNPPPPPPPNNVPEPGTLGLLMTGLIGLGITRRRKQRSA